MTEEKLKVVNLSFLNSSSFRNIATEKWIDYSETTPNEAAHQLVEGDCDLAVIPIAELYTVGDLEPLRFGIFADGPVDSVFLFSQVPLEQIETIYLDEVSRTSAILLKILLHDFFPEVAQRIRYFRKDSSSIPDFIRGTSAGLVIGDRAIEIRTRFPHQFDLAEIWCRKVGLPFVFAVWAARRGVLTQANQSRIEAAFLQGHAHQEIFARDWAEHHGVNRESAVRYVVENIHTRFDDVALRGAKEFLRRGIALKFFPDQEFPFELELDAPKLARTATQKLDYILTNVSHGARLSCADADFLAQHSSLGDLGLCADLTAERRRRKLRFEVPQHFELRISNICVEQSQGCSHFVIPEQQEGFVLAESEVISRLSDLPKSQGRQISLRSGLMPELGLDFHEQLIGIIKQEVPCTLAALSIEEVAAYAKILSVEVDEVAARLQSAGLDILSSWIHHLLVTRERKRFYPRPLDAQQWIKNTRRCHDIGLQSAAAFPISARDTWRDRILHLYRLRQLQDETNGFAWCGVVRRDDTPTGPDRSLSVETYMRAVSMCSIFFDNIPLIESSPFWFGTPVSEVTLSLGADRHVVVA